MTVAISSRSRWAKAEPSRTRSLMAVIPASMKPISIPALAREGKPEPARPRRLGRVSVTRTLGVQQRRHRPPDGTQVERDAELDRTDESQRGNHQQLGAVLRVDVAAHGAPPLRGAGGPRDALHRLLEDADEALPDERRARRRLH